MHAYIICGSTPPERQKHIDALLESEDIHPHHVTTLDTEERSIGIENIRDAQATLAMQASIPHVKAHIIKGAQRMTTAAQNALLKSLEEPPSKTIHILDADSIGQLLPTIISRSHIIRATMPDTQTDISNVSTMLHALISSTAPDSLKLIDEVCKDRNQAKTWTKSAIETTRHIMLTGDASGSNELKHNADILLERLISAYGYMSTNIHPKLLLDDVFIASSEPRQRS